MAINQDAIISLMGQEKADWENGTAFITERVAFNIRPLIRELRKNYWSVFTNPIDPVTGRKKTYVPLTESVVESVVKNIDFSPSDIRLYTRPHGNPGLVDFARFRVEDELDDIGPISFGEHLDDLKRRLAIDGTAVWRTDEDTVDGKRVIKITPVDLLNFYIDPTAEYLQKKDVATIERIVMDESSAKDKVKKNNWLNLDKVTGDTGVDRYDAEFSFGAVNSSGTVKLTQFWKRYGLIPKEYMTGKESDEGETVMTEIIASGDGGPKVLHSVKLWNKPKPYEEFWYTRVPGRWYGRGPAEKMMMLQIWMNTVVNIRINRHYVSQLGLFKIKRNRGITPQAIKRLPASGAILVDEQDDIEQLAINEASNSSYADEDRIHNWARQVTSAFEAVTGETLPASITATTSSIQSRSATSQFAQVKKGVGNALNRWLKRHALPIINKNVTKEDILRYVVKEDSFADFADNIANELVIKEMKNRPGMIFDPAKVELERKRVKEKIMRSGSTFLVKVAKNFDVTEYDGRFHIQNDKLDPGIIAQNLNQTLQILSNTPGATAEMIHDSVRMIYDALGLPPPVFKPQGDNNLTLEQQGLEQKDARQQTVSKTPEQQTVRANAPRQI